MISEANSEHIGVVGGGVGKGRGNADGCKDRSLLHRFIGQGKTSLEGLTLDREWSSFFPQGHAYRVKK